MLDAEPLLAGVDLDDNRTEGSEDVGHLIHLFTFFHSMRTHANNSHNEILEVFSQTGAASRVLVTDGELNPVDEGITIVISPPAAALAWSWSAALRARARARLLAAPSAVAYVGDRVDNDVIPAAAAPISARADFAVTLNPKYLPSIMRVCASGYDTQWHGAR